MELGRKKWRPFAFCYNYIFYSAGYVSIVQPHLPGKLDHRYYDSIVYNISSSHRQLVLLAVDIYKVEITDTFCSASQVLVL